MTSPCIRKLKADVQSFTNLTLSAESNSNQLRHRVIASIHQICSSIVHAEEEGVQRVEILKIISPAREIHNRSPFINRLQTWPRGYPGDFETIEYLCSDVQNSLKELNSVESHCEWYALQCAAAQQHRNKLQHQANLILETILSNSNPNILILACGSSRDLAGIVPLIAPRSFHITLIDTDQGAIDFSKCCLDGISDRLSFFCTDVMNFIRNPSNAKKFDLILAGGLFDYLSDKQISLVLGRMKKRFLGSGGKIFFTNIALGNPYRPWITYLADWHLIERTENQLAALANPGDEFELKINRDQTGLTLLTTLTNARVLSG